MSKQKETNKCCYYDTSPDPSQTELGGNKTTKNVPKHFFVPPAEG